jgi:hypothetical protein
MLINDLKQIDVRIFADRDSLSEAMDYMNLTIEALPLKYRAQIYTGVN